MEHTKLTSQQLAICSYLGLYNEEIEQIAYFDQNGFPVGKDGEFILGDCKRSDIEDDELLIIAEEDEEDLDDMEELHSDTKKKNDIWANDYYDEHDWKNYYRGRGRSESTYDKGYASDNSRFELPEPEKIVYKYEECHSGTIKVFEIDGISVYGGGSSRDGNYWGDMIILDLADRIDEPVKLINVSMPEVSKEVNIGIVKIDWHDYGVPALSRGFWESIVVALKRICREKGGKLDVLCCCIGGHGRTGTALSILASLFGVVPDGICPVTYVRDHYCKKAVESDSQISYVQKITGVKVTAEIEKRTYSYSTYTKEDKK